jgi:hypothetical protein
LKPHCPDCKEERENSKVCSSCEILKQQLESVNYEKNRLLDRIMEKPIPEVVSKPMEPTRPVNIPWNIRRQMLESEDREKAKLLAQAPKPISTEELEKELDVASEKRENQR